MRYALSVIIVYAMFAFVIAEPNPFEWDGFARFVLVVFVVGALIAADYTKEDKQ